MRQKVLNLAILVILFIFILNFIPAQSDSKTTIHFFYGQGCPHCGKALDFLDSAKQRLS